jgi:hypothetical protein
LTSNNCHKEINFTLLLLKILGRSSSFRRQAPAAFPASSPRRAEAAGNASLTTLQSRRLKHRLKRRSTVPKMMRSISAEPLPPDPARSSFASLTDEEKTRSCDPAAALRAPSRAESSTVRLALQEL